MILKHIHKYIDIHSVSMEFDFFPTLCDEMKKESKIFLRALLTRTISIAMVSKRTNVVEDEEKLDRERPNPIVTKLFDCLNDLFLNDNIDQRIRTKNDENLQQTRFTITTNF